MPSNAPVSQITRLSKRATATIANGQTVSDAIDISDTVALGLVMPAAFTGTTLTFQVSADNSTFQALYDSTNTQVSLTVAVSRSYDLPAELASWPFFKIVSGSAEGGARSLVVVSKG